MVWSNYKLHVQLQICALEYYAVFYIDHDHRSDSILYWVLCDKQPKDW